MTPEEEARLAYENGDCFKIEDWRIELELLRRQMIEAVAGLRNIAERQDEYKEYSSAIMIAELTLEKMEKIK